MKVSIADSYNSIGIDAMIIVGYSKPEDLDRNIIALHERK
jgi:hypothetical protein